MSKNLQATVQVENLLDNTNVIINQFLLHIKKNLIMVLLFIPTNSTLHQ